MKIIEINILSVNAGEEVVANIILEQKKGEIWNRAKVITVTSGSPEALRKLNVADNERIVIEGTTSKKVVYDREQNMSKVVDADDEVRAAQEKADAATKEANTLREQKQNLADAAKADADKVSEPKTNLGNPAPSDAPKPATVSTMAPVATPAPKPAAPTTPPAGVSGASASPKVAGDHGQGATSSKEVKP